jgi:hypothetical protein
MVLFGAGLLRAAPSKSAGDNILTGRCRAPLWVVLQCLDTLVHVRMRTAQYPLSRYWLELQDADYQKGRVSAYLEFVEEVVRNRILGFQIGQARAVIKKFGFIWVVEEVLVENQIDLIVSLFWKDLTPGKPSKYESLVVHTITSLTREIIIRVDQTLVQAPAAPISGPPPIALKASQPWSGPPPTTSPSAPAASPSAPPASQPARAVPPTMAIPLPPGPLAPATSLRSSMGGHRQNNRILFADMSRPSRVAREEQTTRLVEWPSPQDFHEAVQNPYYCFADKFLRNGMPELDMMGMPRVSSGAFASVYRMRCLDRDRAVRCFLHPIKDQQYRYEVLRTSVDPEQLPWLVDFDYSGEGIRVAGKWYPILMMDWVEGVPLNQHISKLCEFEELDEIEDLRLQFLELAADLREAHVAHGDLQHGNILVQDGRLVLVDYDGMFVPDLQGQRSNELGHANYQHPCRSEEHFDDAIDHFSTWVIDTALLCLREDPSLWRFCLDDGESMLFHRQDFIRPENSAIMAQLAGHQSQTVRTRGRSFRELLDLPLEEIPPLLESNRNGITTADVGESPYAQEPVKTGDKAGGLPDWLSDVD